MIPTKLPEGTTQEQWERYEIDLKEHEEHCAKTKPNKDDIKAYAEWEMMCSCDAPNKPGYYRANND